MKEHKKTDKHEPKPGDVQAPVVDATVEPAAAPAPSQPTELDQLKDRLLRMQADFDNFRRRMQREKIELSARANEELLRDLLPIIDHFENGLAIATEHKAEQAVQDGFRMVYEQLLGTLKKFDVTPVDAHSAAFDPHLHEAVSHIPSNEYAADQIVAQTRRGYKLGDRLLRPVQVVVSSGPGALGDDGEQVAGSGPGEKAGN